MELKEIVSDALAVAGAALASIGAGLVYLPAGLICGGICLGLIAYAVGTGDGGEKP